MYLKDAKIGDACIVKKIDLPESLHRRLQALGMTIDTKIEVINKKGKGIMIIKLRDTNYALGENITKNIEIQGEENE